MSDESKLKMHIVDTSAQFATVITYIAWEEEEQQRFFAWLNNDFAWLKKKKQEFLRVFVSNLRVLISN
jgi:hypothetical protein